MLMSDSFTGWFPPGQSQGIILFFIQFAVSSVAELIRKHRLTYSGHTHRAKHKYKWRLSHI